MNARATTQSPLLVARSYLPTAQVAAQNAQRAFERLDQLRHDPRTSATDLASAERAATNARATSLAATSELIRLEKAANEAATVSGAAPPFRAAFEVRDGFDVAALQPEMVAALLRPDSSENATSSAPKLSASFLSNLSNPSSALNALVFDGPADKTTRDPKKLIENAGLGLKGWNYDSMNDAERTLLADHFRGHPELLPTGYQPKSFVAYMMGTGAATDAKSQGFTWVKAADAYVRDDVVAKAQPTLDAFTEIARKRLSDTGALPDWQADLVKQHGVDALVARTVDGLRAEMLDPTMGYSVGGKALDPTQRLDHLIDQVRRDPIGQFNLAFGQAVVDLLG